MYGAGFETRSGRQIMLSRNRSDGICIWLEVKPPATFRATVERYSPSRGRASSLQANAPRLWKGNEAWKVVVHDGDEFARLVSWYASLR